MATFFLFGKYTPEALKGISADRTKEAAKIVKKYKGKIVSIHALLGETDLVMLLDLPSTADAFKTSIVLNKLTAIAFTTHPAVSVEEFDQFFG